MSGRTDTAVLRRWGREWVQPFAGVLMAAADELDSLRREIEGLRKEIRLGYKHDREREAELAQLCDRHLYETDLAAWQRKTVAEMAKPTPLCTDIPESAFPDKGGEACGLCCGLCGRTYPHVHGMGYYPKAKAVDPMAA